MQRAVPTPATTNQCEPWLQDGALCLIIYSGPNLLPGPPNGNRRGRPDLRQAPNTAPAVSGAVRRGFSACAQIAPAPKTLLLHSTPVETLADVGITSTRTSGSVLWSRVAAVQLAQGTRGLKMLLEYERAVFSSLMTKMSSGST